MGRHARTQPANAGSSMRTSTSTGSPSSARVEGINPKSYGKVMPAGRTFFSAKTFSFRSKAYLLRLPFGVSTTTRTVFLSSDDFNNDGSRRLETSGRLDMMSFIPSAMAHSLHRYGSIATQNVRRSLPVLRSPPISALALSEHHLKASVRPGCVTLGDL